MFCRPRLRRVEARRACFARQREDALEKLRLLLLHIENLAQIFQLALLLLLAVFRRLLRVDAVEKIVRRDLLVAGEQAPCTARSSIGPV